MSDPATLMSVAGGVATITLNRPQEKNSLGGALTNSLYANLQEAMERKDVNVIILTNNGNTFCAGANLKQQGKGTGGKGGAAPEVPKYGLPDIFHLMHNGPKVVIGRINGHCTGGGCGLAAACDVSVMANTFQLGFTEVRIGVSPAVISVVCLPKIRRADAAELFLSGEKVSAERVAQIGLINYAVPPEQLDAKVNEIANKMVLGGPNAMRVTKSLVYKVPQMEVGEAFKWTAKESAKCFASPEAKQGILAFNKRVAAPWVPKDRAALAVAQRTKAAKL